MMPSFSSYKELIDYGAAYLKTHEISNYKSEAEWILLKVINKRRTWLVMNFHESPDSIHIKNYMDMIKMKDTGLDNLVKKGYSLLNLNTFFTSGPEESRAWTIKKGTLAPEAAGTIHTDFQKGFIRAETVSYEDFIDNKGWVDSKNKGKMRLEGKEYIVKDGDILNYRFNT